MKIAELNPNTSITLYVNSLNRPNERETDRINNKNP